MSGKILKVKATETLSGSSKFKWPEIIPDAFPDHSGIKLYINNIWNICQVQELYNIWKLNNSPMSNQWVKEDIKRDIKKYISKQVKMETKHANKKL